MHIGPLQLAAIAFENPIFKGEILAELDAVRGRGVIRLIDLLFIYREASGDVTVMTDTDVEAEDLAAYGDVLSVLLGLGDSSAAEMNGTSVDDGYGLSLEEIRGVVDQMPPDTALALVLFEHRWAGGLAQAIREAGGHLLAQGILTREAVLVVGSELAAIAEAEAVIATTEAIKGAAVLDALAFTEAAAEAEALMADEMVTSAIAAETLRTLMAVGVVDDTEIETAILSLVEGGLLSPDLVADALEQADAALAAIAETQAAQQQAES
ncbi:hypothetical protein [Leptolyngbya iicbica]|uniref:DUF1269 domain-containing protein n=2 Tax=Cyanophyceae TaxID=3028117 RepID=A0A4Q7E4F9_9CYAN|nr:hypothetical protein [Leptolyngbya sp. LK]RZM76663.1 hypothetical protein DYY88_18590 [Leptolyngbya sp. LK]